MPPKRATAGALPLNESVRPRTDKTRQNQMTKVYAEVRNKILHLELLPGSTFTEGDIAAELGISKTPVREGLLLLAWEGLVHSRAGSGYEVSSMTMQDAQNTMRLWNLHGTEISRLAAKRGVAAGLLSDVVMKELKKPAYSQKPKGEWPVSYFMTYHLIASATKSRPLMSAFVRNFFGVERLIRMAHRFSTDPIDVPPGMEAIVKAILAQDADAAANETTKHISEVERRILRALVDSAPMQAVDLGRLLRERVEDPDQFAAVIGNLQGSTSA